MNETQEYQGQILATNSDGETQKVAIDKVTKAIESISPDHTSIHNGETFIFSGMITGVLDNTTVAYGFKTPASGKVIHLKSPELSATANKVRNDLYEAPTNAPVGTDLTAFNKNRNSANVSAMQSIIGSIVGLDLTGATMIENRQFINTEVKENEWILKPNTFYIRTLTNQTGAACDVSFMETWIEEDI